ncbi:hypothetical protein ZWY2020_056338 [Hordeum vulgare]|nr:hypothetical protein ZWY2020_056338 [Hordeum vulgare]
MLGTDYGPNSFWQFYAWIHAFLPGYNKIYTVGLTTICWALWLARNRATFEKKWINTPFEIVFTVCAFIQYWTGLQKLEMAEVIKKGAEMLKENASQMLLLCGPPMRESSEHADEGDKWEEWWRGKC